MKLTWSLGGSFYWPQYNVETSMKCEQYLLGERGVQVDVIRHFRYASIGFYAMKKPDAKANGGFRFQIALPPYKYKRNTLVNLPVVKVENNSTIELVSTETVIDETTGDLTQEVKAVTDQITIPADYGMVNIELAAKILKANPDKKYKVAGYADKATGSTSWNQKLSEKRAQSVYDALIKQGVDKDQLELIGFGGTANMFGKNFLNRVVILE